MRTWLNLGVLSLLPLLGCKYESLLNITSNPDGNQGFRCFASDSPRCPPGLSCCVNRGSSTICDDDLAKKYPTDEGWCVPPPPPADTAPKNWLQWDLGPKNSVVAATGDPMLSGTDESGAWRCPRDDKTPREMQPPEIARKFEPNDTLTDAIVYSSMLPLDSIPPNMSPYEICPDKSAPNNPDVDVFKFKITTMAKVVAEVSYQVSFGDVDIGLFREGQNDVGDKVPARIRSDVTTVNNACLSETLSAGTYYVAVRGAPRMAGDYNASMTYEMNNYRIRIYALSPGSTMGCTAATDMK